MRTEDFEKLVANALERFPDNIKKKINNVVFLVEEKARNRRLKEQNIKYGQTLLGLYEGIPRTKRGEGYFNVLPDKITIFQWPIENMCADDPERIKELVYEVVWHEVGHHFGFSEAGIRQLEKKKFQNKLNN
jgi:predicted Zn-dependent protease with MMP-like domain